MRRDGEGPLQQTELLAGGHDMIVNSVVVDGDTVLSGGWDQRVVFWVSLLLEKWFRKLDFLQKQDGTGFKLSESVKLDSYINVMCRGSGGYYAGGKEGYLVKIAP